MKKIIKNILFYGFFTISYAGQDIENGWFDTEEKKECFVNNQTVLAVPNKYLLFLNFPLPEIFGSHGAQPEENYSMPVQNEPASLLWRILSFLFWRR